MTFSSVKIFNVISKRIALLPLKEGTKKFRPLREGHVNGKKKEKARIEKENKKNNGCKLQQRKKKKKSPLRCIPSSAVQSTKNNERCCFHENVSGCDRPACAQRCYHSVHKQACDHDDEKL